MDSLVQCHPGWTDWINQDKIPPSKTHSGAAGKPVDYEPLPSALVLVSLNSTYFK